MTQAVALNTRHVESKSFDCHYQIGDNRESSRDTGRGMTAGDVNIDPGALPPTEGGVKVEDLILHLRRCSAIYTYPSMYNAKDGEMLGLELLGLE